MSNKPSVFEIDDPKMYMMADVDTYTMQVAGTSFSINKVDDYLASPESEALRRDDYLMKRFKWLLEAAIAYKYYESKSTIRNQMLKRILGRVQFEDNGCWTWLGATSGKTGRGYGRISVHGVNSAVHRVMYVNTYGHLPANKHVDHRCNNRLCCNPAHLEAATHKGRETHIE